MPVARVSFCIQRYQLWTKNISVSHAVQCASAERSPYRPDALKKVQLDIVFGNLLEYAEVVGRCIHAGRGRVGEPNLPLVEASAQGDNGVAENVQGSHREQAPLWQKGCEQGLRWRDTGAEPQRAAEHRRIGVSGPRTDTLSQSSGGRFWPWIYILINLLRKIVAVFDPGCRGGRTPPGPAN